MKASNNCISLIKSFEGCRLKAYQDSNKIWTIGYGSIKYQSGRPVKEGDTITQEQADVELENDLIQFEQTIKNKIHVPLTQNQFDALICLFFNIGHSPTLIDMINSKESENKIYLWWISHYVIAGGEILAGLKRRRRAEADLYIKK